MDRRLFLASVGSSLLLPWTPAQAVGQAQSDISLFDDLITTITGLLRAASRPGDFHNRANVLRFLRNLYTPLNSMQVAKMQIQNELSRLAAPCTVIRSSTQMAVDQLNLDRRDLRGLLSRLARAVRPTGMERPMAELSERMAHLYADKSWVSEVPRFCQLTGAERRQLLLDIRASRVALGRVYESLNGLVSRLNSVPA